MSAISPILSTTRLSLRPFHDTDLEHVFCGLSDPEVVKYYAVNFKTLTETKIQMAWFKNLEAEGTGTWWAIFSTDGKVFYGAAGLNNLSKEHRKAEIGFWLIPLYWGQEIMQEAVDLVCTHAFEQLKLHRIEASVESENKNCKSLMRKLNFKYEGTMQDCEIKNGNFISLELYAKFY